MNHLQGSTTIDINGIQRPVKFGTLQTAIFCQLRGINLREAQEQLSAKAMKAGNFDMQFMIDFVYSAFVAGAKTARLEVDFDMIDVAGWFDQYPNLIADAMDAAGGANGPNGNRAQRRAAEKAQK